MQQIKISSNIRHFWQTVRVDTLDKRKREKYRLSPNVPPLSLLFVLSDFPSLLLSLVPSLVSPVLHAEMISISELMRFSWTKISLSLHPEPPSSSSQVHAQIHTGARILCQFQHCIPSAEMYTISDMYTTVTNIYLILEKIINASHLKENWVRPEHWVCLHV